MTTDSRNIPEPLPLESDAPLEQHSMREAVARLRGCQAVWSQQSLAARMAWAGRLAHHIAARGDELTGSVYRPACHDDGEVLASEVLPLADACSYTAARGARMLASTRLARRDAAWWMGTIKIDQQRLPWGLVLIIGPSNYPLMLPGVQLMQAVAAGNAVLVKPAPGCQAAMVVLKECCVAAGMPEQLVQVLDTDPAQVQQAIDAGVDKVIFTGSYTTGQTISRKLVESMTPAAMELSGNDAVVVLNSADMAITAKAIAYALDMNGGQTCIAPRRLFLTAQSAARLWPLLSNELKQFAPRSIGLRGAQIAGSAIEQALASGAKFAFGSSDHLLDHQSVRPLVLSDVTADMQIARDDLFAPVLSMIEVADVEDAITQVNGGRYALGASVFGEAGQASQVASRLNVGCVTVNDCLVPTADPRVSFGGWRSSGFGVTRGLEGLKELTQLKVICHRRGRWMPHLTTDRAKLANIMRGILLLRHGGNWRQRMSGIQLMISGRKSK